MAYASAVDVEDRLGRELDPSETQIVGTRLDDAERILNNRVDLAAKIADGTVDADNVVMIESDMILRLIRNPDGYTQETDGNYSYSISEELAAGRLTVMGNEWALLGIRGGVYVIKPYLQLPWEPVTV